MRPELLRNTSGLFLFVLGMPLVSDLHGTIQRVQTGKLLSINPNTLNTLNTPNTSVSSCYS